MRGKRRSVLPGIFLKDPGRFHLLVVGHLRVTFLRFRMEIFDPFMLTATFSKGLINVWS